MTASVLTMKGIVKTYGGVPALAGVDFSVRGGEVHALLGANGAGKSTLMKVLSGAEPATAGTISIDGTPLVLHSPRDAKRAGIHLVCQEVDTGLIPYLSAAENILLDVQVSRSGLRYSPRETMREAREVLTRCGFELPLDRHAERLSLAEKQLVLIARAVAQDVRFVIFDEPTAPLSLAEAETLFALINRLKERGIGIVYISHRLPEVFQLADRLTVLRDGRNVWESPVAEIRPEQAAAAMLGKSVSEELPRRQRQAGEVLLDVRGLCAGHKVRQFDVQVRAGEVVAVVGLVGAGKTEASRLLFGADRPDGGSIRLDGRDVTIRSPREAVRHGIVLIPEERRQQGVLVEESVQVNVTLARLRDFCLGGVIRAAQERERAQEMVERLGIKTSGLSQLVGRLSGGNQQKVAVGKWLLTDARVYLFDEPTKGVDIGAKADMFRLIDELARHGKGVLYFSSEIDEAMRIADRMLVMEGGRIVREWRRSDWTEGGVSIETVMYYASGGGVDGSQVTA